MSVCKCNCLGTSTNELIRISFDLHYQLAAEKDIAEAKTTGERTLRRAGTSITSLLPLPGRKPKKPLTPEELEERRKKVLYSSCTFLKCFFFNYSFL